jgi:hypothetical protein
VLRYFLWMAKLSGRARWAVILGGYFGAKLLRKAAAANPGAAPFLWTILALYVVFCLLTWLADPLFNLLLRLDRFGRLVLSREEIVASNWVGACLLLAVLGAALGAAFGFGALLWSGVGLFALLIPLAATFQCRPGWPRTAMSAYTASVAALGGAGLGLRLAGSSSAGALLALFVLGLAGATWVGNALVSSVPRR